METNKGYGVCRLNVVAIRTEPDFSAPLVSQLLFGEHYEVLEKSTDTPFVRIRCYADGTEGWLDSSQHYAITPEYFDYLNRAELKITTDITARILFKKLPIVIVMGSIIPISSVELFRMEEQFAFNGEAKNLGQFRNVEFLKAQAMKYVGAPFFPGGRTPFGIDGGGLVQMLYKFCGYSLPRFPEQQIRCGRTVAAPDDIHVGDLIFIPLPGGGIRPAVVWDRDPFRILHVAEKVRIDEFNARMELKGIRRILSVE